MKHTAILSIFFIPILALSAGEPNPRTELLIGKDKTESPTYHPFGVDFDTKGNMYVVELEGGRVHKRTPDGKFSTIAGNGKKGYKGDGGPAKKAVFNGMHNLAVTPSGDLYIADSFNSCIRKIDLKTKVITTIAGTGKKGFSGDGGPANKATFNHIMCITLNKANDKLYIADLGNKRIRVMDLKTGIVNTVAGNGKRGIPKDGASALKSPLVDPRAVAVDSQGKVYILERGGHALRVVTPDGKIYTVAGTGKKGARDGSALAALLNSPKHLCVDDMDNVIIADDNNALIRVYDPRRKTLKTILGKGIGTPPITLARPHGVCFEKGELYVADSWNNRILKIVNYRELVK